MNLMKNRTIFPKSGNIEIWKSMNWLNLNCDYTTTKHMLLFPTTCRILPGVCTTLCSVFSVLSELFSVVCCVLNVPGNLFSFARCYIFESANLRHWPGGDSNISPFLVNIASIFCLNFLSISISQISSWSEIIFFFKLGI